MKTTDSTREILERLDALEPISSALEEEPAERRSLTERVVAFADQINRFDENAKMMSMAAVVIFGINDEKKLVHIPKVNANVVTSKATPAVENAYSILPSGLNPSFRPLIYLVKKCTVSSTTKPRLTLKTTQAV